MINYLCSHHGTDSCTSVSFRSAAVVRYPRIGSLFALGPSRCFGVGCPFDLGGFFTAVCYVMCYVRTPVSRLRCRRVSLKSCTCTLQNHMTRNVQSDNSHCTSNSNLRLYAEAIGHSHSSLAFRRHVQSAPAPHTPIHGRWPPPPLPVRDVRSRGLTALVNGSP